MDRQAGVTMAMAAYAYTHVLLKQLSLTQTKASRQTADASYGSGRTGGMGGDTDAYGSGRTQDTGYGGGVSSGPGHGNQSSGHREQVGLGDSTRSYTGGHDTYGSGTTGGTGFGNKSSSYGDDKGEYGGSAGMADHNKPYSGGHDSYGSGTTGGPGYGNKSSSYGDDDDSSKKDSTAGKLMEKVGGMFKNENLERKGADKRNQAGRDDEGSNY